MKKSSLLKIVVGMPAYNESRYIGSIVLCALQYANEVVVVDDGSTDLTSRIANLAGATVIKHKENLGYGVTIQTILKEAKKRNADVLVIIDADGQHDPQEINRLIEPLSQGFDFVIGSRQIDRASIPLYRRFGLNILAGFTRILAQKRLSDTESGFRAFSRKALEVLEPKEEGMAISAEVVSLAAAKGLKIKEVPISVTYAKDSSTLNPVRHGLGVMNRILVMISERRPLLFFGLCGGIAIILGITAGISVVWTFYTSELFAIGTALISILLITIGLLCISTGVILNVLVRRMSDSIKSWDKNKSY